MPPLALAVHPKDENIVYAGTVTDGMFLTRDGGRSWHAINGGLRIKNVGALVIDSTNPAVIYAGLRGAGVYKSLDAGASWQASAAGMDPQADVRSIVLDPANSDVVYVGSANSGVFRSTDGGKLWTQINAGLTVRAIRELAISADGACLYAASDGAGVFRLDLQPATGRSLAVLPAASFVRDGPVAPESIVSLYGEDLAPALQQAGSGALPTMLGETQVSVTDVDGVDALAQLYFVSPHQINLVAPAAARAGAAMIRVLRRNSVVARATVRIEPVAPGIFTANSDGKGAPAALILRIAGGASPTVEVYRAPLDLGGASDQVILELFGTGIRDASTVTATMGGVDAPVLGFAAQSQYPGLDQVNVRVPYELKGRGEVDVLLTADGKAANAVRIRIQ